MHDVSVVMSIRVYLVSKFWDLHLTIANQTGSGQSNQHCHHGPLEGRRGCLEGHNGLHSLLKVSKSQKQFMVSSIFQKTGEGFLP